VGSTHAVIFRRFGSRTPFAMPRNCEGRRLAGTASVPAARGVFEKPAVGNSDERTDAQHGCSTCAVQRDDGSLKRLTLSLPSISRCISYQKPAGLPSAASFFDCARRSIVDAVGELRLSRCVRPLQNRRLDEVLPNISRDWPWRCGPGSAQRSACRWLRIVWLVRWPWFESLFRSASFNKFACWSRPQRARFALLVRGVVAQVSRSYPLEQFVEGLAADGGAPLGCVVA